MDPTKGASTKQCQKNKTTGCTGVRRVEGLTKEMFQYCKAQDNSMCFQTSYVRFGKKVDMWQKDTNMCPEEKKTISGKKSGAAAISFFGAIVAIFVAIF